MLLFLVLRGEVDFPLFDLATKLKFSPKIFPSFLSKRIVGGEEMSRFLKGVILESLFCYEVNM